MVISLINGYIIKKIKNEEVLFLYVDFDSEFAVIDKRNNTNLKKLIKKYIKNNKINFKGSLVTLVVGGIMLGTITINKPKENIVNNNSSKIVAMINNANKDVDIIVDNNDNFIVDESTEKVEVNNDIKEEKPNTVNNTSKVEIKKELNSIEEKKTTIENNSNMEEKTNEEENIIDNNIYVNLYRKNGNVETIELEEYIIGVVGAEMPASFNIEALKAQAVVARTYAVNVIKSNRKLTDNNSTQNYKSNEELKNMWKSSYNTYYDKIKNAVYSTKGLYLTYNGSIIDAVYHSTSNGYTEDAVYVWGNSVPYLKSVESNYDNTNKSYLYTSFISYIDISNKLNNIVDINTEINIIERNSSGRIISIDINGITYSGVKLRSLLGLRSTDFDIEKTESGINFITRGYGHGVGMSQYGANGMANNGSSFKDILSHYYSGVSINSL